ncbi:hypothetical protein H0H87_003985 [Tephrocybe sp. NHM501043]|nr:hypothetical protein H0H87_003985 [Tephrocybe sp. NHM501043]
MPWDPIKLNDVGVVLRSLHSQYCTSRFGTWKLGNGQSPIDQVDQALSVDTAQAYRNEAEAGVAIRESGLAREDIFITTKYSGTDGLDIPTSIVNSLKNLGVSYVDLYLIHHPRLAVPDIQTAWKQMEELKEKGLVKSIGVSNFGVTELEILVSSAKVKPAANQIMLHPYVFAKQKPIIEFGAKHGIITEAYSALMYEGISFGGPLDKPLYEIATRLNATPDQVILAWVKAKGAVVVTTSSKKYRLEGYLRAADLTLTTEDVSALDDAGAKVAGRWNARSIMCRLAVVAFWGVLALRLNSYMDLGIL